MTYMSVEPGIYQHFKGDVYFVSGVVEHSETHEQLVVYFPLDRFPGWKVWARPLAMFEEEVEYEGQRVPRFTHIPRE